EVDAFDGHRVVFRDLRWRESFRDDEVVGRADELGRARGVLVAATAQKCEGDTEQ
ncbi:uncharacterized protein METZ01_LOCUS213628, partial [marine metagenome]